VVQLYVRCADITTLNGLTMKRCLEGEGMNVVQITAKPKQVNENYRRHKILITYDVATTKWHWSVTHTMTHTFEGKAKTLNKARIEAQRRVDSLLQAND